MCIVCVLFSTPRSTRGSRFRKYLFVRGRSSVDIHNTSTWSTIKQFGGIFGIFSESYCRPRDSKSSAHTSVSDLHIVCAGVLSHNRSRIRDFLYDVRWSHRRYGRTYDIRDDHGQVVLHRRAWFGGGMRRHVGVYGAVRNERTEMVEDGESRERRSLWREIFTSRR